MGYVDLIETPLRVPPKNQLYVNFLTTGLIFDLKESLDIAYHDPKHCL